MPTKEWYKSKTIWSDIITIVIAIVGVIDKNWTGGHIVASPLYGMAITFLGALGIYGRATSNTELRG